MISGERLTVDIEKLVARSNDERRTELCRAGAWTALPVASNEGPRSSHPGIRSDYRCGAKSVQLDDVSSKTIGVEKNAERNRFVLDECGRVAPTAGPDGGDVRTGLHQLPVSVTDLTGPFTTRQSSEVPQEEKDVGRVSPQVTKTL